MEERKNRLLEELRNLWKTYHRNKSMGFGVGDVVEDARDIIDELDQLDALGGVNQGEV